MTSPTLPPNCARCYPRLVIGQDGVCPPGCEANIDMLYVAQMNEARGHETPTSENVRRILSSGSEGERAGLAKIRAGTEKIIRGKETTCRR